MDTKKLQHLCNECGLGAHVDRIYSRAMPAAMMTISPTADESIPLGASRFGGTPDLPPNTPWPRTRSLRYLTFVLQINLAECAGMLDDAWPTDGWLHLFADASSMPSGHRLESFEKVHLKYTRSGSDLRRFPHPKPLRGCDHDPNPLPVLPAGKIEFTATWSLPDRWGTFDNLKEAELRTEQYAALREKVMWPSGVPSYHQLGGHATQHQQGAEHLAATRWHGIDTINLPHGHPSKNRFNEYGNDWRLVVQLDGNNQFGEWLNHAQRFYLMAHAPCVASHTFDRYWPVCDID